MEIMKAKLLSLSIYKGILETEPVQCLLRICDAKSPDVLIRSYSDLIYSVYSSGFSDLSEYLVWHLKYDRTFVGNAVASGSATEALLDAAAMDIRRLSGIGQISCSDLKRRIYESCTRENSAFGPIVQNMPELPAGREFTEEEVFESYRLSGCGQFALGQAFHWEKGRLTRILRPDIINPDLMIGYERQREAVIQNTKVLLQGGPASNVLLYGDSGTGKSATVKSLIHIPEFYNLRLIEMAKNSLDELIQMTMQMVNFTVHDERIIKTRKVLTLEQFRDERARGLATKHFLTGLTEMFTHIFAGMMDKGLLRRDDPAMLAFAYTTPISALIHLCDREPEKTADAIAQVEAFSRHFVKVYGEGENEKE